VEVKVVLIEDRHNNKTIDIFSIRHSIHSIPHRIASGAHINRIRTIAFWIEQVDSPAWTVGLATKHIAIDPLLQEMDTLFHQLDTLTGQYDWYQERLLVEREKTKGEVILKSILCLSLDLSGPLERGMKINVSNGLKRAMLRVAIKALFCSFVLSLSYSCTLEQGHLDGPTES
jgi:hypothetical protein